MHTLVSSQLLEYGQSKEAPLVVILLATFNGEQFLNEQLDSIISQTYRNWVLIVRDDASRDATRKIVSDFSKLYSTKILFDESVERNLGAKESFLHLMRVYDNYQREASLNTDELLIMFCDQDDIWDTNKLSVIVTAACDAGIQDTIPLLIHSDLSLINERGDVVADSMASYQGLFVSYESLLDQCLSNSVTGCAMAINHCLLQKALKMPDQAIMHDWWISLIASALGERIYIESALVKYRQHQDNTIGAIPVDQRKSRLDVLLTFFSSARCELYTPIAQQAKHFLSLFHSDLYLGDRIVIWFVALLDRLPCPLANLLYMFLVTPRNLSAKRNGHR